MEEIFQEIILLLGGTTVVLAALFGFVGKVWLSRIIERNKASTQQELVKLQSKLDSTLKRLEAELQHAVFVDKLQFEHEFTIYKEVWSTLVELRMATMRLRSTLDYVDPSQSKEERVKERLAAFAKPFDGFRDLVEKNKPFYSSGVYDSLIDVLEKCYGESVDYEYTERKTTEYFKEARENQKQILEAIESACAAIRSRIEKVKVV